jgi:hypothetical protein
LLPRFLEDADLEAAPKGVLAAAQEMLEKSAAARMRSLAGHEVGDEELMRI